MNRKRQPFISPQDAKKIDLLLGSAKTDKAMQAYCHALVSLNEGETMETVARNLGVTRKTISKWKKRYETFGLEPPAKTGKGHPSTAILQASIVSLTNQAVYRGQALTAAKLAKRLSIKVDTVQQVWKQLSFPVRADGKAVASLAVEATRSPKSKETRARRKSRNDRLAKDRPAVRLDDIAQEAGVSSSTVSRALRGDPAVSDLTAQRIKTIAERQGYRPDPMLKALAERRWKRRKQESAVAFLLEGAKAKQDDPSQRHPNKELWKGFSEQANRLGFKAEIYYSDDYPNYRSLARVLYNRGIEGVAIGYMENTADSIEYQELMACLAQRQLSLASASWKYSTKQSCTHIFPGIISTWNTLVERLEKRRRRRIGITVKERWQPMAALSARYAQLKKNATVTPIMDEGSFRKFEEEMGRSDLDLVIGNDWHYDWLLEMGYSIPRDIRFVSREKIDLSDRRIAGIDPRMEDHGAECARYLDLLIRNHIRGLNKIAPEVHLAPRWIKGDSFPEG